MRLRWELSKIWSKPLHDPEFDEIPSIHWQVYAYLLGADHTSHSESERDKIEYLARFWDNKAVSEIQRMREAKKHGPSDDQFEGVLERNFGKGIGEMAVQPQSIAELGAQIKQASR